MRPFVVLASCCFFLCASVNAHNITKILEQHPDYATFNKFLSQTKLADEINSRKTITVLVVSNDAMADPSSKSWSLSVMKKVLSLHVLLDYFDPQKLHEISNGSTLSTTLYQTTGNAIGNSGFLNITDLRGGKVGFGAVIARATLDAMFVKSVKEEPYNVSVLEISKLITPSDLTAPAPSAADLNITAVLEKGGCKIFAKLITATGVVKTFGDALTGGGGLTLFAPTDEAFGGKVMAMLAKLSSAQQVSLLEYHALPAYTPLGTLKTTASPVSTLATNGASRYALSVSSAGDSAVVLSTGLDKTSVTNTLLDDQPIALYSVEQVLLPVEIFGVAPSPAPVPLSASAPAPAAAPKAESPTPTPPPTPTPTPPPLAASPPAPPTASEGPAPAVEGPSSPKPSSAPCFYAPLRLVGLLALPILLYNAFSS